LPPRSTPSSRAAAADRQLSKVRRRYKINLGAQKKLLPGEIPHVIDMVIVLKLAGYSQIQIARTIGISREQTAEFLKSPVVAEKLVSLRKALPQAALDLIQGYMIEAVQVFVEIIRTEPDNKIRAQAAAEILDRGGLPKASKMERHNVNEERMTFTDEGIVDRLRDLPVEVQEKAAQMIEQLESMLSEAATDIIKKETEKENEQDR